MCQACTSKFGEFNRSSLCEKAQEKFKLNKYGNAIKYEVHRIKSSNKDLHDIEVITIINDL